MGSFLESLEFNLSILQARSTILAVTHNGATVHRVTQPLILPTSFLLLFFYNWKIVNR